MKKILFSVMMLCSTSLFAQYGYDDEKPFNFGIAGALSLPVGSFADRTTYGVGFQLQPSVMVAEHVEAFMQLGIDVFKGSEGYGYSDPAVLHIPLLAGARFKASGFFLGAGVGYGLFTSDGSSAKGFMYSPQAGYDFGKVEVGLNYTSTQVTGGSLAYAGLKLVRKF